MRDEIEEYRKRQVRPFGINPASVEEHAAYVARLELPFPLLSDGDREIGRRYGVLKPDGKGIARTVYLIDRDGTIRFASPGAPGAALSLEGLGELEPGS